MVECQRWHTEGWPSVPAQHFLSGKVPESVGAESWGRGRELIKGRSYSVKRQPSDAISSPTEGAHVASSSAKQLDLESLGEFSVSV